MVGKSPNNILFVLTFVDSHRDLSKGNSVWWFLADGMN